MVKKSLDEVLKIIPSLFEINLISDKDGNVIFDQLANILEFDECFIYFINPESLQLKYSYKQHSNYVINKIFNAEDLGTMFIPTEENLSNKKRWIGYATNVLGKLVVNDGAKNAIIDKCTSLLPIGIVEVVNDFKRGEVVSICDETGLEFARGMVNYDFDECEKLIGAYSDEFIEKIPYSETQNYVKKVFRSYWNYVRLYME